MNSEALTPAELLAAARTMIYQPRQGTSGLWARAAALLARQALEELLDALWVREAPGVEHASTTCQLLCLPAFLPDRRLAGQAAHAWAALTHACHHHPYELAPTAEELDRWLEVINALARTQDQHAPQSLRQHHASVP
jgi:hypothetical protein